MTLLHNVLQDQNAPGENTDTTDLSYTLTDSDGSTTVGLLHVNFNDDAPQGGCGYRQRRGGEHPGRRATC